MATNTNRRTDSDRMAHSEQPSYHDGSSKNPWDIGSGRPTHLDNDQDYDSSNTASQPEYEDRSRDNSIASLRHAENNAIADREPSYIPSQSQPSQDSFYTGKGRTPKVQTKLSPRAKAKSFLRNKGAIITIAMILLGGGIFLSTSNSILAPALSALMTANTQTSYTSYALRAKFITKGMMNDAGGAVTTGFTGAKKYSRIPNYLKSRLSIYGIEVNGSGRNTTMSWTHTNTAGITETINNIDADQFINLYNTDPAFRESYTNAKRGRVATFFDKVANKIYQKLGISRNLFSKFQQTNDADVDATNYANTMEPKFEGSSTTLSTRSQDAGEETPIYRTDADGNIVYENGQPVIDGYDVDYNEINGNDRATTGSFDDAASANTRAGSMIANVAQTVGQVGTWACTAMKVGNMIAIAAAAQETYQSIQYFMGQMENVSKMMAGYGDESAINPFLNFLTTSVTTNTTSDFKSLGVLNIASYNENSPTPDLGTVTETGAPIEASGLQVMLADAPASASDTANYSLERVIKSLGGAAAFGIGTTLTCAGFDIATSLISIGVSLAGGLAGVLTNFILKFTVNLATTITVSAFLGFLIPTVAKVFFANAFDDATGIAAGQLLARGGATANMREGRSGSGQAPSGKQQVAAFNHSTQSVIAQEAEVERLRTSPFDTSSPHTFFGSIAYSLLPTITSTNLTGLSSFLRSTSTSLASLMGRVSADGESSNYLTTPGDCPLLDTIGVAGDLYCNPIVTTDMSTIEMSPTDANLESVLIDGGNLNCDSDGNCTVIKDSNLSRYISYCDNRDSPFGVIDQNILNELNPDILNSSVLGSLPIIGDLINAVTGAMNINPEHIAWANGERCGNTDTNKAFWNSEGKYYQRYIEDQRILEQMGAYEDSKNPVTAYEEVYDAKLALQYEGLDPYVAYYSRISGLSPANTETVLAYVYYYNYVDNYDPSTRIATNELTNIKSGEQIIADIWHDALRYDTPNPTDDGIYVEDKFIAHQHIVYADIRNRSYAA